MRLELTESFDWDGRAVRWASFGTGPAVVLCHGTPWSSFVWRHVADALNDSFTVYVWDMLGYGQSDKSGGDVSLDAQGRILAALVESWGLDRPHVIAHDFGGAVALRAHLIHDVPMGSLALIDVVALRPWGSPFFRLVAQHADVFKALPPKLHEALLREYISGASSIGLRHEVLDSLAGPWLDEVGQSAFYRQIAEADERHTDEIEPLLGTIAIPTHIVWGREDTWIPVERAARLHALIPNSTMRLIDNAGHLVQEDQPAALTTEVYRWITRQSSDDAPR